MLDPNTKALLPEIIRETMDALHELTNAPDEMTLPITLAIANFAAQAIADVDPMAWPKCAVSEYFTVLVPSGGMKTSISDYLLDGLRTFERDQDEEYETNMIDYQIEMKKFQSAIGEYSKNSVGPKPTKPKKPRGNRYKVEKPTVNGLLNTLDSVPFATLVSSDAGEFFNSHSFTDQNKALEMVTMLSKAWSGETLDRTTGIEENNVKIKNRRFNMLVLLQQQMAGFLNNSQYKDQGFTNRMLITQCELFDKLEGKFSDKAERDRIAARQAKLKPFNKRVYDLLNAVEAIQVKNRMPKLEPGGDMLARLAARAATSNYEPNELVLERIHFNEDDDAMQIMEDFYNETEVMKKDPRYNEYINFITRAYEHACRLAATLAIFDRQETISAQYAMCGVELVRYFLEQRLNLNIDGTIRLNPIIECAKDLRKWIGKRPNKETTKQDLAQKGPASYRNLTKDDKKRVLENLEDDEFIVIVKVAIDGAEKAFIRLVDIAPKVATLEESSIKVAA